MDLKEFTAQFWNLYFHAVSPQDAQHILDMMEPGVTLIGTGAHEFYEKRDTFVADLHRAVGEHQELTFSIGRFTATETVLAEDVRMVCGLMDVSGAARGSHSNVTMDTRYTMIYRFREDRWRIAHIHRSVPFLEQKEGEYYPRSLYKQLEEVRTLADAMAELASKDSLTGLYNLRTLGEYFDKCTGDENWLILGDLDNFKRINDICGHMKGNDVLKQIAGVLKASVRSQDAVARVGGDEFVLLCRNVGRGHVEHLLSRILHQLSSLQFNIPFEVGISLGATQIQPGENLSDALRRADQSMYAAKRQGKSRFCIEV